MRVLIFFLFLFLHLGTLAMQPPCREFFTKYRLYTSLSKASEKNSCQIKEEHLHIRLLDKEGFAYPYNKYADFSSRYLVHSDKEERVAFFFIATDSLRQQTIIRINGQEVSSIDLGEDFSAPFLLREDSPSGKERDYLLKIGEERIPIGGLNDVVYFEADLKEGNNSIELRYPLEMRLSHSGFLHTFYLSYLTSPAQFWGDSSKITVAIDVENNLVFHYSYLGKPQRQGNVLFWNVPKEELLRGELYFSFGKHLNLVQQAFISLGTVGLASLLVFLVFIFHLYRIKKNQRKPNGWDIFLEPVLFFLFLVVSEKLINAIVGDYPFCKDTFWISIVLGLMPFSTLAYGLLLLIIYRRKAATSFYVVIFSLLALALLVGFIILGLYLKN